MGIFASELEAILEAHIPPTESKWMPLFRMGVHPTQVQRLMDAVDNAGQVATLPGNIIQQLRQELPLTTMEYARLRAGVEADTFLRLVMLYHNYPTEEAMTKANAVFQCALKDRLATGGKSESVYPLMTDMERSHTIAPTPRRRGRARKVEAVGV